MRFKIFLFVFLLLSLNCYATIDEINQHTTEITRQSVAQINSHTDAKLEELNTKGNELIARAEVEIKAAQRTAAILMFCSMTFSLIFALVFVEMIKQYIWKKRLSVEPLVDLDSFKSDARLWIKKQFDMGYGKRRVLKEMIKNKYSKKLARELIDQVA